MMFSFQLERENFNFSCEAVICHAFIRHVFALTIKVFYFQTY